MPLISAPLKAAAGALLVALCSVGVALADPVTVDTSTGPVELAGVPDTIAALDIAAIDTLGALGVVPGGIVTPLYLDILDRETQGATVVGTMFEANFEKLAALRPDLIIVGGRSAAQTQMLSRLAPVIDMSIGPDAIGDGIARLHTYGALFGKQPEADALEDQLDTRIDAARAAVAAHGGRAMIILTNGPKVSAYGATSRFGWLHTRLNWPEAVEGIQTSNHGEPVSFEYIAQANPDTLLVIDRGTTVSDGAQNAAATLDNPLVAGTEAWKSGRVIYLSTAESYVAAGGIRSLMRTLDQITDALNAPQPEAKP
ncbi:siderophore ABC transporter substrate-binding protein [Pseudooceanicola sediminis]|uniref:Siderophore ABC transporter substrate-binding protein n=1 Tax=Pseudooceanicola sediminis TaxID=2211117 RepID=A0A399J5S9_9RHOB|nr:siderophore ABC transporter substrate-binding protein [Pseudooceanicola sediminis]KAA2314204.1 siderophore ABC transporter substrate-binding protein [Puniceibacterium sp. HSS470]RII39937.1 siderophore ABC transporter substrate-binding protein [Pseudooceanicola sediminis]|tara:strand:+ start:101760 stop:102698 length:939 start_codon:yes stop_codon:yes gene_type:complete